MNEYIALVSERLAEIQLTQLDKIEAAGKLLAEKIKQDRLIYVYGAGGHSSLAVGEMFFRIGGLANIYPIAEYGLSALSRARSFIEMERTTGLGAHLIDASQMGDGDVLMLFHTIGVNPTCIDAAKQAKALGALVIGIASSRWQDETPSDALIRSENKENLRDLADIYIDDCNTVDDAELLLQGMDVKVGPLSGIGTFAIAHMIEVAAIKECLSAGLIPPVWSNANTPEGAKKNVALMEKYEKRINML